MAKLSEVMQAVAKAPEQKTAITTIEALLKSPNIKGRFEEMLREKAPGFISSIITAVNMNPKLKAADPMSVIASAAVAAALDLPINPNLGFAHIVPYSGRAQFQMGWKGFVQLAMRTGQYKTINASEVYEDELQFFNPLTGEFSFTDPTTWKYRFDGKKEKIVGYMAFFRLINGFEKYVYSTRAQVDAHARQYSQSYSNPNGQWQKNFQAMALKTMVKLMLSKWGILSVDMQKAIDTDQAIVNADNSLTFPDAPQLEMDSQNAPAENGNGTTETEIPKDKDGNPIQF